jgi:multidrug resistance efflux pump
MRREKSRLAVVFLVLIVVGSSLWWASGCSANESTAGILTSGFIEAKDVAIAPEVGGRIVEIGAGEGDNIKAGAPLVRLDDTLLKAQQKQAETNVKLAQAYLNQSIVSRDGARKAWENALDVQRNPLELEARIIAAQGELEMAELNLVREKGVESGWRIPAAEIRQETAEKILENLQLFKANFLVSYYTMNKEILPAEGELKMAELALAYEKELEIYWRIPSAELSRDTAKKALENLLAIRGNPQEINAAVDQAYTAYQTAAAAVGAAERQVEQAEASLGVIGVQFSKLGISSPVSGVVAAQDFEVGEMAQPGASILTITELEEVTLTAYVPESKIGLVKLGQEALVTVDSYPGETFPGEVAYISPRAMFTPKNIQLKEEREKMVFAVKIKLENPEQKLKPGMPADANILTNSNG